MRTDEPPAHALETWERHSPVLGCVKRVSVLVPRARMAAGAGVGVLFLLHGFGGSRMTWLNRTGLARHLAGLDLMVVLPESGRRWFINDDRGHRYEDYLVDELVPFIGKTYGDHVRPGPQAIGGFSMGGAAALMQALRHPEVFSVVVSHAGAFEAPSRVGDPYADLRAAGDLTIPCTEAHERVWGPPGSAVRRRYDLHAMIDARPAGPGPAVYFDVGSEDYPRILRMNRAMARKLRESRLEAEFHERRGAHDLEYLDRALPFSLQYVADKLRTG